MCQRFGGPATTGLLNNPSSLAVDAAGNLYISDGGNHVVRKVMVATGIITTVAGNGTAGYSGDGGPATSAQLGGSVNGYGVYGTVGVAVDGFGNLFIAESGNNRVRKVAVATGIITTVAGNGTQGYSGDGGPATSAQLWAPRSVAADGSGNIYIADTANEAVRKVAANTGIITTVDEWSPGLLGEPTSVGGWLRQRVRRLVGPKRPQGGGDDGHRDRGD